MNRHPPGLDRPTPRLPEPPARYHDAIPRGKARRPSGGNLLHRQSIRLISFRIVASGLARQCVICRPPV